MGRRLTTEEFIQKATDIHKGKYTYEKVEYVFSKVKVIITCPIHGDFLQIPNDHLMGKGCVQCYKGCCNSKLRMGVDSFIKRSNEIHNNRYTYDKVKYINARTKVEITCSEHGSFFQTPYQHLKGSKCPKCCKKRKGKIKVCKIELFIKRSKSIWGEDTFDYTKVKYKNNFTKVTLTCREHNTEFNQQPSSHLSKRTGCPECLFEKTGQYKNGYWSYDKCVEISKQYEWLSDFVKNEPKCYDACKEKGWVIDFVWLKRHYEIDESILTATKHCIYAYFFPEFNSVYIGLTLNLDRRHKFGHSNGGTVFEFCKENNIDIPSPIIIESDLTLEQSKVREQYWIDHYKQNDYKVLNRRNGGSVGLLYTCKTGNETENFIKRAKEVHGDKYDYSKVEYKNTKTKVCIICPYHGEFWQIPNNHINLGRGCPTCGGTSRLTTVSFIRKAREVHRDMYCYDNVVYTNSKTKVCIVCPEHGMFKQTPNDHLMGSGCSKCGRKK